MGRRYHQNHHNKQTSKKKKNKNKSNTNSSTQQQQQQQHESDEDDVNNTNWVERVRFSVSSNHHDTDGIPERLSIISWNILANSYCNKYSQCHLPKQCQKIVFSKQLRQKLLLNILKDNFNLTDIICLQEMDILEISETLQKLGYSCIETPRNQQMIVAAGSGSGRSDSCAIFVRDENWEIVDSEIIYLDDLATLTTTAAAAASDGGSTTSARTTTEHDNPISDDDDDDDDSQDATPGVSNNNTNTNGVTSNGGTTTNTTTTSILGGGGSGSGNIQGIQQSFLRRNMAILVRIRQKTTTKRKQQTVCIANTHLYWNPGFEYVKLCQAHYVLQRLQAFVKDHHNEPVIVCGDFNSRPHSITHTYLTRGYINAKQQIAPWYNHNNNDHRRQTQQQQQQQEETIIDDDDDIDEEKDDDECDNDDDNHGDGSYKEIPIDTLMEKLTMDERKSDIEATTRRKRQQERPHMRYLLDNSLNKFCRWLRILGQDVALETDKEEKVRTRQNNVSHLFQRCRRERRTLVTTSPRLMQRKSCPASAYCLTKPNLSSATGLEQALIGMLRTHGVILEPRTFLTRCVVCNGRIVEIFDEGRKREILCSYEAPPELIETGLKVYECDGCRQGYWWNESPTSSASRVKATATHLLQICARGGVAVDFDQMGMFADVDLSSTVPRSTSCSSSSSGDGSEDKDNDSPDGSSADDDAQEPLLQVIEWLNQEHLTCPFALQSVYADDRNEESLPFTNVTHDFVSTLDYIFVSRDHNKDSERVPLRVLERLYVPTTFAELAGRTNYPSHVPNNLHLLPSNVWPSDHLAVGAKLEIISSVNDNDETNKNDEKDDQRTNQNVMDQAEIDNSDEQKKKDHANGEATETVRNETASTISSTYGTSALTTVTARHNPMAPRCTCGCIPLIPSLFEMAEMRRQAATANKKKASS